MFDVDSDHDENEASDDNDSRTERMNFPLNVMPCRICIPKSIRTFTYSPDYVINH